MSDDGPCCSNQDKATEVPKSITRSQNRESSETSTSEATPQSSANEGEPDGEEDIVDLCRQLDTQLEEKAKMHNLNALNVKSILHRLIRDPHVLSTLMGIKGDADDIPTLKVTRSKVKHSASEAAKVELKPVQPPRTFLDVQFENEDEDEDYRPEEAQSDESEEEDDGNDTLTLEPELAKNQRNQEKAAAPDAEESSPDLLDDGLMISDGVDNDGELSPYQLRSRVPHIDENTMFDPLDSSFPHDSFDTFTDYHGQEMLTFVENPDYLNFLQGIQASTPAHENENVVPDDDDPDDEEYNVLTELDKLKELEKDKDEIRMDRFTEIPMREVEGLFLDLIGDDVQTIQPELISMKTRTPKKKRTKKRRSEDAADSKNSGDNQKAALPVDEPPPDGSYSCSLISGEPITFKPEELAQLRIQLEQHVQLLTQSVVMCFHDDRLLHVKNDYQLMIGEIISAENSREAPVSTDRPRNRETTSSRDRRSHSARRRSRSPALAHRRHNTPTSRDRTHRSPHRNSGHHRSEVRDSRRSSGRASEERTRADSGRHRARRRSSDAEWEPEDSHERKRLKREQQAAPREAVRRSSRRLQRADEKEPPPKVRKEDSASHQRSRRNAKESSQKHFESASTSVTVEFRAGERIAQVFRKIKCKVKEVVRMKEDLSSPVPTLFKSANVELAATDCTERSVNTPCLDNSENAAERNIEVRLLISFFF
ncbi:hypothetical protein OESDEN_06066 [Oesophagostomum dentatum]|uniref:Uncharacterized protein n=1 Tax=Oesophagostomum dentatum TaxID=61180 RepID=A0A0B1TF43_OESDE|nr:hypothetical protein OESDEN_06066 [Oesophagostomum dentatum]